MTRRVSRIASGRDADLRICFLDSVPDMDACVVRAVCLDRAV